jgi:hypothetical protein
MKVRQKLFTVLFLGLWLMASPLLAQKEAPAEEDEFFYERELTYGINLNTNGGLIGGVAGKYAIRIDNRWFHHIGLEIVNVKNPKEERLSNPQTNQSFIPQKMNYLFVIRPQYGREYLLFKKGPEDGVHLNAIAAVGPSFGLLKPYYILYSATGPNDAQSVPYNSALHRRNTTNIYGSGSFFDGFDELKVNLGISLKLALSFEFGQFNDNVIGIEVGGIAEQFGRKLEIMDVAPNRSLYTSGFITLYYGNKE